MIFYIFISIVFLAELIIFAAIMVQLVKFDRFCLSSIKFLDEAKPKIKNIFELVHGISEQVYELVPIWVENMKSKRDRILQKQLESVLTGLLFWKINTKILKKLRKNKMVRMALKGLTLIQSVI